MSKQYPNIFKRDSAEPGIKVLKEIEGGMKALKQNVEALCGQVYDEELSLDIDMVLLKESEVLHNSFPIMYDQLVTWRANPQEDITKPLDDALQKNKKASLELRQELQKITKRIEELLVGDETT
jgi:hypothetical protein